MRRLVAILFFVMNYSFYLRADDNAMVVSVPVANVWTKPDIDIQNNESSSPRTQLLYGERVEVLERIGSGWCRVKMLEQPFFNRETGEWAFYEDWVLGQDLQIDRRDHAPNAVLVELWVDVYTEPNESGVIVQRLPFGTLVLVVENYGPWVVIRLIDGSIGFVKASNVSMLHQKGSYCSEQVRRRIVDYAHKFFGSPYRLTGRTAHGVDCSGLVSLVYRACDFSLPRLSHAQFVKAHSVAPKDMMPGDLVFLKRQLHNFERVTHVMMYVGDDNLIEATIASSGRFSGVRYITGLGRFGKPLALLNNGERVSGGGSPLGDIEICCGSFFSDSVLMNELRIK